MKMTIDRHQHNMIVCLVNYSIWAPNSQKAIRYSYFKQFKLTSESANKIREAAFTPKRAGHDSKGKVPWVD